VTVIEGGWVADGVISSAEYTNSKTFGDYEIHWTNDIDYIFVAIRCKTSGWVAVGFKPERRMKNADMVYGFVEQGKVSIFDMFSTGDFGPHPPDVEQGGSDDILEFAGAEEDGFTTIEFKRSLDTGDSKDQILTSGGNAILWACGSGDSTTQRHARRGTDQIELK